MSTAENVKWFCITLLLCLAFFLIGRALAPQIPPCAEDEHVTQAFTCVSDDQADFSGGYWYERGK